MEANEAKKPKRPRIGQPVGLGNSNPGSTDNHYENRTFNAADSDDSAAPRPQGGYQQRPYAPRPQGQQHRQQCGYQPRNNYGPRQQGGYQPRPYGQQRPNQGGYNRYQGQGQGGSYAPQPRPEAPDTVGTPSTAAEGTEHTDAAAPQQPQQGGYQQHRNNYGQQRPYNNNRYNQGQGGYNRYNNQGHGGYQQRNQGQGGYNRYNNQGQGGYQQRNQGQGGYNRYNNQGQGGYGQQRPNQGNRYNQGQGGYQQRPNQGNRYNNQGQGGYGRPNQGNRYQKNNGPVRQGKSFTPRPKRVEYEMPLPDPDEKIRLNKFMANAGLCSRREADEFIQQGLVKVNGEVVTELGTKISHSDTVEYDEKVVALESKCYILLNKPKDCVTTSDDPNGRTTVLDLVKGACNERIYPVGRLDRNTTGVLLLTNDGDLASKLTHPKYVKKKIYHVWTDKDISEEDMQRIADGIELEDGPIHADAISYATETDRNQAGIEIHSGRNRIVRRIFESLGYHVTKLDRVYFAGLTKKNLPRGRWRYLTQEEVNYLKMGSFE